MWKSLIGYVMIEVEGVSLERFISSALACEIPIWDVKRRGRKRITLLIRTRDFMEKIPAVRRKYGCNVRVIKRKGRTFLFSRLRHRKALIVTGLMFFAIIPVLCSRIFFVDITGLYAVDRSVVSEAIAAAGITMGMARDDVQNMELASAIRAAHKDIAWVGIDTSGVTLSIEVVEAIPIPDSIDESIPVDIVSAKDGVVTKVVALYGKANVKPGDTVREGDILIRGDITREGASESLLVHANGSVVAKVIYEGYHEGELTQKVLVNSGNEAEYKALYVAGMLITESENPFENGSVRPDGKQTLTGIFPPVEVVTGVWCEQTWEEQEKTLETVLSETAFFAQINAMQELSFDAMLLNVDTWTDIHADGRVESTVSVEALEQIGIERAPVHQIVQLQEQE